MPTTYYTLLWIMPATGAENVSTLDALDNNLDPLYAHVMLGTSMERKEFGQTAVRLFGAADESAVWPKLEELGYSVVDREIRSNHHMV